MSRDKAEERRVAAVCPERRIRILVIIGVNRHSHKPEQQGEEQSGKRRHALRLQPLFPVPCAEKTLNRDLIAAA